MNQPISDSSVEQMARNVISMLRERADLNAHEVAVEMDRLLCAQRVADDKTIKDCQPMFDNMQNFQGYSRPLPSQEWWQLRGYVLAYPGCPDAWRVKHEDMPENPELERLRMVLREIGECKSIADVGFVLHKYEARTF